MKKRVNIALSTYLATIFAFSAFAGCGGQTSSSSDSSPSPETEQSIPVAKNQDGNVIMLADKGKSDYTIVICDEPDVFETFAAQELQQFLAASTGATIPIVSESEKVSTEEKYLLIGNATDLQDQITTAQYDPSDAYVDVDGATVYLTGAQGYGILNAVYQFLEYEIGFKAYATEETYYEIKESVALLDFDQMKYEPNIDYINARIGSIFGPLNRFSAARQGALEGTHRGGSTLEGKLWAHWLENFGTYITSADEKAGIEAAHGEELNAIVEERLADRLAEKVEEYIAENGNEPTEEEKAQMEETVRAEIREEAIVENAWNWFSQGELCLSKPEISDCVTEYVKQYILDNPKAEYLLLSNGDTTVCCECIHCKTLMTTCKTMGGVSLDFVNRISKKLEDDKFFENNPQVNKEIKLCFLNYYAYVWAPVDTDENGEVTKIYVEARDNVGVFLCPITACNGHALDDPDCPVNIQEYQNLKNWSAITDYMGLYAYWANYRNYFTFFNNWAAPRTWSRVFEEIGMDYVFVHGVDNTYSPLDRLRTYLYINYLKDPEYGEFDDVVKDFMQHYYKVAADELYGYYETLRRHTTAMEAVTGSSCVICYDERNAVQYTNRKWWSWETLNKLQTYIEAAYDAIEASVLSDEEKAELKDRILIEKMTVRYWKYKNWSVYYTEEDLEKERLFLAEATEKLGLAKEQETANLVW